MKTKKGFTLIELLVVIAIIGILAVLIIINMNGVRERVRDTQRKSDLSQIKNALYMYKIEYQTFPINDTSDRIMACNPPSLVDWGMPFKCGSMTYMKILPYDPGTDFPYRYDQINTGEGFCLIAVFENKSDGDITKSRQKCLDCGTYITSESDYVQCEE